jgi:hypothetical protein
MTVSVLSCWLLGREVLWRPCPHTRLTVAGAGSTGARPCHMTHRASGRMLQTYPGQPNELSELCQESPEQHRGWSRSYPGDRSRRSRGMPAGSLPWLSTTPCAVVPEKLTKFCLEYRPQPSCISTGHVSGPGWQARTVVHMRAFQRRSCPQLGPVYARSDPQDAASSLRPLAKPTRVGPSRVEGC